MAPERFYQLDELEFEREIKGLGKKEFVEFRKKFREFTGEFSRLSSARDKEDIKETLRIISKKLHLVKREHERREVIEKTELKIKDMLMNPDDAIQMDEADFTNAIRHMKNKDFRSFAEDFQNVYLSVLQERKNMTLKSTGNMIIDKRHRMIFKRWDLIEAEVQDRKKRTASPDE